MLNQDAQWELTYEDVTYRFGRTADDVFCATTPEVGEAEVRASDSAPFRGDGLIMGIETRGGSTITFDLAIVAPTEDEARRRYDVLATAWRADALRSKPGATATLTSRYRGERRHWYGRPRKLSANTKYARQGHIRVSATFDSADGMAWSDRQIVTVPLAPPTTGGGITAPIVSPITTSRTSTRQSVFVVDATAPVVPTITINGYISNPRLELLGSDGWWVALRGTIPGGQAVVISARTMSAAFTGSNRSAAGMMDPRGARISSLRIPPGVHEFKFSGTSDTRLATASITWRNAYHTA